MKKLLLVFSVVFLAFFLSACGKVEQEKESVKTEETQINNPIAGDEAGQNLFATTMDVSKEYLSLRLRTDDILMKASEYSDYESWNKDMNTLVNDWQKFDEKSIELEKLAEDYSVEKVSFNFNFVETALAYDKQEISNIFDKAPAGKKIKTLAKFLGVDAKKAAKILQQSQNEIQADVWNEEGDAYKKLEVTATVVKDGCKVAGFVGGIVLTGGTSAIVAGGTMAQTAVVVAGADLVLEVSDDAANIALGDKNKVSEIVGSVRSVTEPAAAILSIATMPENIVTGIDKLNVFVFGADQFRSVVQDGKVIGISLPKYERGEDDKEIGMTVISREDIDKWLDENGYERYDGDVEDIFDAYDDEDEEETENIDKKENNELENLEDKKEESPDNSSAKIGAVKVSIVSPLEPEFQRGQARMWEVKVDNFISGDGASYKCDWKFYMDGVVYREQQNTCGFTNTFIDKGGSVTAEATVTFLQGRSVFDDDGNYIDYVKDVIDTVSVSKEYTVVVPVDTYRHP